MRSLAERLRAFEQKKAKLADVEAKLKLDEKRVHLRRCIRIGDLAIKAGLSDWSEEMFYGAMLALAGEDAAKRRKWSVEGADAFAAEKLAADDRTAVVLTFQIHPASEVVAVLRAGGFRFNRLLRHWEGLARIEDAEKLAESHGGVARSVAI